MTRFSERHGFQPPDAEITVRHDAPSELRGVVVNIAYECGYTAKTLRPLVCSVLRRREDSNNWSTEPVDRELRGYLDECEWFEVYDVIEAIHRRLQTSFAATPDGHPAAEHFESQLNAYFRQRGVGWILRNGSLEARGSEDFERTLHSAQHELAQAKRYTAAGEIHEAIVDLSRRPQPDVTGSIQHALAALECVARDVTGDSKSTLGAILSRHPDIVPAPLNLALEKLWGFASEQGRHLREGRVPGYEEAEISVQVACAVARYLSKKLQPSRPYT